MHVCVSPRPHILMHMLVSKTEKRRGTVYCCMYTYFSATLYIHDHCWTFHLHCYCVSQIMVKTKEISQDMRQRIIALSTNTSKSHREIARNLSLPNITVSRIIKLHQETGDTVPRRRCGRPRATTITTDRALRREVLKKPFTTAAKLKRSMAPLLNNVSVRTVQHRKKWTCLHVNQHGNPLWVSRWEKAAWISATNTRIWTVEQWKTVMFSDETTIKQLDCIPQVVRRPPGSSPVDPKYTRKTVKHSPGVMVWGCFSHHGRGALSFLEKGQKMNSEVYIKILDDKIIDFMRRHNCTTFQQDKAPCHASKRTMAWFTDQSVSVLSWPGNSPDLNPIENLWRIVKKKINYDACKSLPTLRQEVTRAWCLEVTPEVCAKLVESMPSRIAQIIKNRGYPIKYWRFLMLRPMLCLHFIPFYCISFNYKYVIINM